MEIVQESKDFSNLHPGSKTVITNEPQVALRYVMCEIVSIKSDGTGKMYHNQSSVLLW